MRDDARARARGAALLLLALAATLPACRSEPPAADPPGIERVVFVTIDTLRADHLGAYGYPRLTSPFLNALAGQGMLFERAYATSSLTAVSHASLFTSLHPSQHRVVGNWMKLPHDAYTQARMFREAGFETAGFPSVRFLGGLQPGFDTYKQDVRIQRRNWGRHSEHQDAQQTIDRVIVWLHEERAKDRFFVWIHLFDVHQYSSEYPIRPRFLSLMTPRDEGETRELREWLATNHYLPDPGSENFEERSKAILESVIRYDAQIRFVDDQLRRLSAHIDAIGFGDRTLWVVTADHGEGLGNHDYLSHAGRLYDEMVRVPAILYLRGSPLLRGRLGALVRHVDLMPTLAELAEIPLAAPAGTRGSSIVPLLAASRGSDAESGGGRLAYSERGWGTPEQRKTGQVAALQSLTGKYILRNDGEDEFYDLAADPSELTNRADADLREKEVLRARLAELMEGSDPTAERPPARAGDSIDPEVIESLKALGYVDAD